jgi:DNA-binding NarL/FixJ family response regulator
MPVRILIADDMAELRTLERQLLEQTPELQVVGEATNAQEAISMAAELKPDLVVMDLKMPGNGLTATRHIRETCPEAKILAVTALADRYVLEALKEEYRVDAVIPKDQLYHELIPAINRLVGKG